MSAAPRDIRIFVSYRRKDALKPAQKIYAELVKQFGSKEHVFQDASSIIPGFDYEKIIDDAIGTCDVFLVVIGTDWLTATDDEGGSRRLDDENDRHRREIEAALRREIPVLPVLVDPARMPREDELPGDLKTLHRIHAQSLDMNAFDADVGDLIAVIRKAADVYGGRVPVVPTPTPVDEDDRRRAEALEHATRGEFLRALEIASSIEDPSVRADVLLAVGQAQIDAGSLRSEAQDTLDQARAASAAIPDAEERDRALAEAADVQSELTGAAMPTAPAAGSGAFPAPVEIAGVDGTISGDNAEATKEPGEPDHAGNPGGRSVWYRWTAPVGGSVTIDTFGSDFDTLLAVYRGSDLADLALVVSNDDADGSQSRVAFRVLEGEEYRIAVDGYAGATGSIVLNWSVQAPPPNGSFVSPEEVAGPRGTIRGDSTGSSKEPGEPDHAGSAGGSSVWYRWTAPEDGVAIFDTFESEFDTLLAVYRGSTLAQLEQVAANDDAGRPQSRVTFRVAEGDEYRIAVDGYAGAAGAIVLNWAVEERESLVSCLDAAGLRYVDAGAGAVVLRLPSTQADEVVVDAKDSAEVTYFSVDIPEYTGFGARAVLQSLLKVSYAADYVKGMSLEGGGFAVAAEIPSNALERSVCEGLVWALAAMGDVRNASDLRNPAGWSERLARCTATLDRYLDVDPDRARAEIHVLFQDAGLVAGGGSYVLELGLERRPLAFHLNRRVISLMVSLEGVQPGGDRRKLDRLLELNRLVDVAKVGLTSQGDVTLLYEVPRVVPGLLEHASGQLRTLYAAVRAAV